MLSVVIGDGGKFKSVGKFRVCLAEDAWLFEEDEVRSKDDDESRARAGALRLNTVGMCVRED
jgi:hypothetical protein